MHDMSHEDEEEDDDNNNTKNNDDDDDNGNNHLQIQCNKMRDFNAYLEELVVGHHLISSLKKHVIFIYMPSIF